MDIGNLSGLIPIVCGTYLSLAAYGVIAINSKDPERNELWLRKFGGMMRVLGPIVVFFGVLQLLGVF